MISKVGYDSEIVNNHKDLKNSNLIIIPGVGNFSNVMNCFAKNFDLIKLKEEIDDKKIPILGICVGMQIMGTFSDEGNCKGLDWIKFDVKKIQVNENKFPLPHMGWNIIKTTKNNNFFNMKNQKFYFVHSYHCKLKDENLILNKVNYGEMNLVSSFSYQDITGVQFHPEKSHKFGENFFKNYLNYYL